MTDLRISEHYILYIDILGYKSAMLKIGEAQFLQKIDSLFARALKSYESMSKQGKTPHQAFSYKFFSDNIVVAIECDIRPDISQRALYSLCYLAYVTQGKFMLDRLMLRGAITKGMFYISDNYVFGSGLINAHELERIAMYPRIIVDKSLNEELHSMPYTDNIFLKDSDGYTRIHYLSNREQNSLILEYLRRHKELVENGLVEYINDEKVHKKYAWCREYHNRACFLADIPGACISDIDDLYEQDLQNQSR